MRNPTMTSVQLLFAGLLIACAIFLVQMNIHFCYYMNHSIERKHYKNVTLRVILGLLTLGFTYEAIKYLPLTVVSLVQNLNPLVTAVLSYFILKVGLSKV
jgi:drug/metabolite transporter (DMT)-like permease